MSAYILYEKELFNIVIDAFISYKFKSLFAVIS